MLIISDKYIIVNCENYFDTFSTPFVLYCGMYIPLSDDKHRFVQKIHSTHANGHWEHRRNSNPVATLTHAAVVLYATI